MVVLLLINALSSLRKNSGQFWTKNYNHIALKVMILMVVSSTRTCVSSFLK